MTAKPPPEFFADLRSRLTTLLEASSRWLRPDQLAIVSELIEVNEGGLALEMVSEMLCEVHATLDDGTVSSATELAERMGRHPRLGVEWHGSFGAECDRPRRQPPRPADGPIP